jgi:hypothetical protein
MFKKTITFEDFNGVKHTKDFYFHVSSATISLWLQPGGEFMQKLERVQKSGQVSAVVVFYKEMIAEACGIRSEDGMRFIQTPEAKSELLETPALDVMLLELMLDPSKPIEFLKNLLPKEMLDKISGDIDEKLKELGVEAGVIEASQDNRPAWEKEGRMPTKAEFATMSPDEQRAAFAKALSTK